MPKHIGGRAIAFFALSPPPLHGKGVRGQYTTPFTRARHAEPQLDKGYLESGGSKVLHQLSCQFLRWWSSKTVEWWGRGRRAGTCKGALLLGKGCPHLSCITCGLSLRGHGVAVVNPEGYPADTPSSLLNPTTKVATRTDACGGSYYLTWWFQL